MILGRRVEYALMALKYLEEQPKDKAVSAKEVADHFGIPFDMVARSLQLLARAGWIESWIGSHGGYRIHPNVFVHSLYDLIELLEGGKGVARCFEGHNCEFDRQCVLMDPLRDLNHQLEQFLRSYPLTKILNPISESHSSSRAYSSSEINPLSGVSQKFASESWTREESQL